MERRILKTESSIFTMDTSLFKMKRCEMKMHCPIVKMEKRKMRMDRPFFKMQRREMRMDNCFLKTDITFSKEQLICSKKYVFSVSLLFLLLSILFCYHRMPNCATGSMRLFFKR